MERKNWMRRLPLPFLALAAAVAIGCSQESDSGAPAATSQTAAHEHGEEGHEHAEDGHNLHGYWCAEHGVPEAICARCDTKLAADFQQKGDWCAEHGVPDSQCFICHPELKDKFAAQYEAKFGKKPPEPEAG